MPLTPENFNAFTSFQLACNGWTLAHNEYRGAKSMGLFSADELDEMFAAFERGDNPADFAQAIYEKDTRAAERQMAGTIR